MENKAAEALLAINEVDAAKKEHANEKITYERLKEKKENMLDAIDKVVVTAGA